MEKVSIKAEREWGVGMTSCTPAFARSSSSISKRNINPQHNSIMALGLR